MAIPFSRRTAWDTTESGLARLIRSSREEGVALLDLTQANPTACGFDYDETQVLDPLTNPASMHYEPNARGIPSARQAISDYYRDHGAQVNLDDILLTTSTSEAYSFLFRLLCNAGDEILVAQPSYPLFDFLADLDDVRLVPYPLFADFGWWIDLAELERRITPLTRGIVLVHPNNPTGHATTVVERQQLEGLCVRYGLALIVDEVFLDYSLGRPIASFTVGQHPCMTFVISGLSKIAGMPQMKVGWMVWFGPDSDRREAWARLEVIADTFLSINAPMQHALPVWLAGREAIQRQILLRVRKNLRSLQSGGINYFPVEAGWCAILRLPQRCALPNLAEALLQRCGLIVHPGSYYAIAGDQHVVVSLLGLTEDFIRAVQKLNLWCEPDESTMGTTPSC